MTLPAYDRYAEDQVLHASPMDIVVFLYNRALVRLQEAEENAKRNPALYSAGIEKALRIIDILLEGLRPVESSSITENLQRLYFYMQSELTQAHGSVLGVTRVSVVRRDLATLLEGWEKAAEDVRRSARSTQQARVSPAALIDAEREGALHRWEA
ncbi:MAG: flagellar protein FliS [Bryobacterales bacterium]|nr:flagellar protein FliS [Bryobacterales bacterium]